MTIFSSNLGLTYPSEEDYYDVNVFNQNFSTISDVIFKYVSQPVIVASYDTASTLKYAADVTCPEGEAGPHLKIAADAAGSGKTVLLLDGTYDVGQSVYIDHDIVLTGVKGTVINQIPRDGTAVPVFTTGTEGVVIKDITIKSADGANTSAAMIEVNSNSCVLENVVFDLTADTLGTTAVNIKSACYDAVVKYCKFNRDSGTDGIDIDVTSDSYAGLIIGNMSKGGNSFRQAYIRLLSEDVFNRTGFSAQHARILIGNDYYTSI